MRVQTAADFGAIIRARRLELGLDQQELATMAAVSRHWVLAVERGKARADVALILRTVRALGLDVHVLASEPSRQERDAELDAIVERTRKP